MGIQLSLATGFPAAPSSQPNGHCPSNPKMTSPSTDDLTLYGPLASLIGTWTGDKGMDIAPEPDGTETNPYYETITFEAIGDVENAEEQVLMVLHYRQVVRRKSNDKVFHDQTGYWMWDKENNQVMHSFTIPRGVCVLAGGEHDGQPSDSTTLQVAAQLGDSQWGIVESPFMNEKASTLAFSMQIKVAGDELSYYQTTSLNIYGSDFAHTDENDLTRQSGA